MRIYLESGERFPHLDIRKPIGSEAAEAVEVPDDLFERYTVAGHLEYAAQRAILRHLINAGQLDDEIRERHWRDSVNEQWRAALRSKLVELLDSHFRYTLELRLDEDIPAAAEALLDLFAGPPEVSGV